MLHTQGLQWILDVAIRETQSVPASFYLGWCTESTLDANARLADLTELAGNGYARVAINSNGTDWTSAADGADGRKVTSKTCTFSASGGDWSAAGRWFLATTSDDSGVLIASGSLNSGAGVTLLNGTSYDVAVVIVLTITSGFVLQGLQYLLEVALSEQQSVPANFYRALATDISLADNATLASFTELSGNGYARAALASDAAGWFGEGAGDGDYQVVSDASQFTADGGAWSPMIECLCTTIDGTGKLIGWRPLNSGSGRTVADGESFFAETGLLLTG